MKSAYQNTFCDFAYPRNSNRANGNVASTTNIKKLRIPLNEPLNL